MPSVRVKCRLNKNALSRIFSNILGNAIKYSSGDLNITMTDDGEIIFSNTAPGLDQVQVGRFFDRYYTVEAARKPDGGIGLAIARSLTEAMGGSITARYVSGRLYIHIAFT
nr:ATP-binding protein [Catenibacillus scindens]